MKSRQIRQVLFKVLVLCGVAHVFRWIHRDSLLIVMMHGIGEAGEKDTWAPLRPQHSPQVVDSVLSTLKKHYTFVSLDAAVADLRSRGKPQKNALVVTFDDGYRSNMQLGVPIFERHNIPFMLYVSTGHVRKREPFWFDRLDFAIQSSDRAVTEVEVFGRRIGLNFENRDSLRRGFARIRSALKEHGENDEQLLGEVARLEVIFEGGATVKLRDVMEVDHWVSLLTIEEIGHHSSNPLVSFGSHTVSHARLGVTRSRIVERELRDSAEALTEWTGSTPEHFAYPDGSTSEASRLAVIDAGYQSATTTESGFNKPGCDLFALRRVHIPYEFDRYEILAITSGMADWVNRASSFVRRIVKGRS